MSSVKQIVLITGANGGLGFELAAQLIADSTKYVLLGSRSAEKGEAAVKELQSRKQPGTVELVQIDVSKQASIEAAAKSVESKHGRLDVLVNNAATAPLNGSLEALAKEMADSFQTNATGPLLTTLFFAPLLKKSSNTPRIVNVSSGAGSIGMRQDPQPAMMGHSAYAYRASKAAMNMITACHAAEYGEAGFKVFAFCPGFTVSNLSSMNKAENGAKPTSEGAAPIVDIINGEKDADHGSFLKIGGKYPW